PLAVRLTSDPDPAVRAEAALALSKMVPHSRTAVDALARALEDDELLVRYNAALALEKLEQDARPAVPAMLKALLDETTNANPVGASRSVFRQVAVALNNACAGYDEAVPALTEALRTADGLDKKLAVAWALGEVGESARPAIPLLLPLYKDSDGTVRQI